MDKEALTADASASSGLSYITPAAVASMSRGPTELHGERRSGRPPRMTPKFAETLDDPVRDNLRQDGHLLTLP